jgi:hypothetical protein
MSFFSPAHQWEAVNSHLTMSENVSLKELSDTHWSTRGEACHSLNNNWKQIIKALTAIKDDTTENSFTRSEARGC